MAKMNWDQARANSKRALLRAAAADLPHARRAMYPGTCIVCKVHFPKGTSIVARDGITRHAHCTEVPATT